MIVAVSGCSQPAPPQSNHGVIEARQDQPTPLDLRAPDERGEFLRAARGDDWARPPSAWPATEDERPCTRVAEAHRAEAISRLRQDSAVRLTHADYRRLTGANEEHAGLAFLLRGFATNNSVVRLTISGADVIVSSEALGGLFNLRRHPCVAFLERAPARVFTWAMYDM
jgi:hypothetical protein